MNDLIVNSETEMRSKIRYNFQNSIQSIYNFRKKYSEKERHLVEPNSDYSPKIHNQ